MLEPLSVDIKCVPSLTRERQTKRFKDVISMPEARLVREKRTWLLSDIKREQSVLTSSLKR